MRVMPYLLSLPALMLFALQLALNLGWSFLFFGARWIGGALVEVVLLWIAIAATIAAARADGAAVAAQRVTDTIKESDGGSRVARHIDRARLWAVQTPQTFRLEVIRRALAAVRERGLLDQTLIVMAGEFGRTPKINNRAGRDHYVRCWSTALAGCGIKGCVVYGASDQDGVEVKDNPVTEGDFFATIYYALSIDPKQENLAGVRPVPLAPFGSKVVNDLLA